MQTSQKLKATTKNHQNQPHSLPKIPPNVLTCGRTTLASELEDTYLKSSAYFTAIS
jgi:hypothetical protein